ncbi:MAG: ABC transporter permease [Alphaproteobacteria bacterium]
MNLSTAPASTDSKSRRGQYAADQRASLALAFRIAQRELRSGLNGFYVFLACIALGVAAIAGVNSLARTLTDSISAQGRTILGGDIAFSIIHRETSVTEFAFLSGAGSVSTIATMRSMARRLDGADQVLVELKAVDTAYPLSGAIELSAGGDLASATARVQNTYGAVAAPELLDRLGIAVGDRLQLAGLTIQIRDTIKLEPDRLSSGIGFGPRLLVSLDTLRETGLVRPGSLITWHYRIAMTDPGAVSALTKEAQLAFPKAGWRIRTRDQASPQLAANIRRFAQFLTLVGLTALTVGGVGVANAVASFVDLKRPAIATLKCLGANGSLIFRIYFLQILILTVLGIAIGLVIGAVIPFVAGYFLADLLPVVSAGAIYPAELAIAILYGLLVAIGFALGPLGRVRDIPATALFADRATPSSVRARRIFRLLQAGVLIALCALAITMADDRPLAIGFLVAVGGVFIILRAVSELIVGLARRTGTVRGISLRMAIRNIHRPGALTQSVVLSLGLGLTLLVTLALIDTNLRRQLTETIAGKAPDFFFVDIQNSEAAAFDALLGKVATDGTVERVPMLRGRIAAVNGVSAADFKGSDGSRWALRGDRGITYADVPPENAVIKAGKWWPADYAGEPLVSMESEVAADLGLIIGDTITVNVLGRNIRARIANTRSLEWESMSINFVMIFSANTFAGAPHAHLATLRLTGDENEKEQTARAVLASVTSTFPGITSVRVSDAIDAVNAIIGDLALAIRAAASLALLVSTLVLGGALAAGHRQRRQDAIILKALGATRSRLLLAFSMEYGLLGLATGLFAIAAGSVAAWFVVAQVMEMDFTLFPAVALSAAAIALIVTVGLGLAGTWRILSTKAAPYLRNL